MGKTEWENKIAILKNRLSGYYDVYEHNMAYDSTNKKIYLFDLQTWDKILPKSDKPKRNIIL